MNKWTKLIVLGVVILGALSYLLISSFSENSMYYAEVSELNSNQSKFLNKGVRVSGVVVTGTIEKTTKDLSFTLKDSAKEDLLNIEYSGIVPDAFTDNVTVIVEGIYTGANNVFTAKTLLAKCPSRYDGLDPKEHNAALASNN